VIYGENENQSACGQRRNQEKLEQKAQYLGVGALHTASLS